MSYVLYADDDEDDLDILHDIIEHHGSGCRLESVRDGYSLLQFLQGIGAGATYPAVILLDMKMPRLNGLETLQLLKTDDMYRLIPVVIFSSRLSSDEEHSCRALGAEVMRKPSSYLSWNKVLQHLSSYIDE